VKELPEVSVPAGEGVQRLEAVDDNQAGPPLPQDRGDSLAHAGEPFVGGGPAEVLVEHRPADRGGVEELQGLAEAEDLLQRLGQGGEVDDRPVRAGVVEGVLLGEDGLARARKSHDHGDPVARQAAAQGLIQSLVPAAEPSLAH
jgi:hypothetical protein